MQEEARQREIERRIALLPSVIERFPPSPWKSEVQPLLTIGPWTGGKALRVPAGGAERWLVHMDSPFRSRQGNRAIDAFEVRGLADGPPLLRLVRKSVWDSPENPDNSLTCEGLFYGGPAGDLAGGKFRLPRLHACASTERGVCLVLEQVRASPGTMNWAKAQGIAEVLGEFGAISHARGFHDSPLIKPLELEFQLETADNLMRMAEFCLPPGGGATALFDALFAVFGDPVLLRRIRERLCPCICHDDAFPRNMLMPQGENITVIIDWGRVRSGFIGYDASKVLFPGSLGVRLLRRIESFDHASGRMFRALWRGVAEADAGIGRESVKLGFDFALLQGIARFSDHYAGRFAQNSKGVSKEELLARRQWMVSVLDFGRRKAEDLARRFG